MRHRNLQINSLPAAGHLAVPLIIVTTFARMLYGRYRLGRAVCTWLYRIVLCYIHCPYTHGHRDESGCYLAYDMFKFIFIREMLYLYSYLIDCGPIGNTSSLVPRMGWPEEARSQYFNECCLSSRTNMCVTRPQWVKLRFRGSAYCNRV